MAVSTFKLGKVAIGGNDLANLTNAALAISLETADRTVIGDNWKKLAPLAKSWSLSLTCKYDGLATAVAAMRTEFISGDGDITTVEMYVGANAGSQYFTGSAAVITGFNLTKSVGNDDEVNMSIEGSGGLGYTA